MIAMERIVKISVVKRGKDYVAMGGPENSGGGPENEEFSVMSHNESLLRKMAMDEARRRGIERVIGLNADA